MYNLVSIMSSVPSAGALIYDIAGLSRCAGAAYSGPVSVITQSSDLAKVKFTSQLMSCISSVLQILLKYFNGTAYSTSFLSPLEAVFPVRPVLYLKDSDFVMGSTSSSL